MKVENVIGESICVSVYMYASDHIKHTGKT